jgi:Gamma-glutamyl cyclotransferase, AIG2-like
MSEPAEVWLFAYGTLQFRKVQEVLFGRFLDGRPDVLPGYIVSPLEITDPDVIATSGTAHHTSVHETGDPHDKVPGTLFRITQAELAAADAYEVADVKRVTVRLGSGVDAFVYVNARQSTASSREK